MRRDAIESRYSTNEYLQKQHTCCSRWIEFFALRSIIKTKWSEWMERQKKANYRERKKTFSTLLLFTCALLSWSCWCRFFWWICIFGDTLRDSSEPPNGTQGKRKSKCKFSLRTLITRPKPDNGCIIRAKERKKRNCNSKKVMRRMFERKRKITFADKWRRLLVCCRSRVRDSRIQMHIANYILFCVGTVREISPSSGGHGISRKKNNLPVHVDPLLLNLVTSQLHNHHDFFYHCTRVLFSAVRFYLSSAFATFDFFSDWNKNVFRTTVVPTSARRKGYHYAEPHTLAANVF